MSPDPVPTAPARVRQHPQVVSNRLGDAGVLVNLQTNRIFELNATGLRVWELIGDGLALAEIGERLSREFSAAPELVSDDVGRLVRALQGEGLLDVVHEE